MSIDITINNLGTKAIITIPMPEPAERTGLPDHEICSIKSNPVNTFLHEDRGSKIRVLVADDHKIMREGLCGVLNSLPDIEIVGEAFNGVNAVEMSEIVHPDIVIMDINMPLLNGIEATRRIKTSMPDIKVIGLSMFEEEESANAMLEAGASAYLHKTGPSNELIEAIRLNSPKINRNPSA